MTPSVGRSLAVRGGSERKILAGNERRPGSKRCARDWPVRLIQNVARNPRRGRPIEAGGAPGTGLAQRFAQRYILDSAFEATADRGGVEWIDDNAGVGDD